MRFARKTSTYGPAAKAEHADTPFHRARREWDSRIGSARAQAFHWRLIALASVAATIVLAICLTASSLHKDVRTYVVEVDELGAPRKTTLLTPDYRPKSAQVAYFLAELVRLVRARPLDPVVARENWKRAYTFLAGSALETMTAYAAADPPVTADGDLRTRIAQITNVLQRSEDTYQVRWQETDFSGGTSPTAAHYAGLFRVQFSPPRNEADLFRNPLGLYVVNFSWSREFSATAPTERPTQTNESTTPNEEQPHAQPTN